MDSIMHMSMRTWLKASIQLGIGVTILLWLLQLADISKVSALILSMNLLGIALASAFFIVASIFVALALYVPLRQICDLMLPLGRVILGSFAGQLLSDITPARTGYLATPFILKKLCGIPIEVGMAGVIATGFINSIMKAIVAGIALVHFAGALPLPPYIVDAILVGIAILFVAGFALIILTLERRILKAGSILGKVPLIKRSAMKIMHSLDQIQQMGRKIGRGIHYVILLIALSLVANAIALQIIGDQLWADSLDLVDYILIAAIAGSLMYIPITIAGLGVQETGYVILLTSLGINFEEALTFALITRALFTGTDIIGIGPLLKLGLRMR